MITTMQNCICAGYYTDMRTMVVLERRDCNSNFFNLAFSLILVITYTHTHTHFVFK